MGKLLQVVKLKPYANKRLVCFSYAGGGASIYMPWEKYLGDDIELVLCHLPGRGSRLTEPCYSSIDNLINDLIEEIHMYLDMPLVFFGHSMGAKIAYELTVAMRDVNFPTPECIAVSACAAPYLARTHRNIHNLPDEEFIAALAELNGMPQAILNNPEMLALCLPSLRADFKMVETYLSEDKIILDSKLLLFGGETDKDVSLEALRAWKPLFSDFLGENILPGGHFFLRDQASEILSQLCAA